MLEFFSLNRRLFYYMNQHMWKNINTETMMVESVQSENHHHRRELGLRRVGEQKPLIINLRFPGENEKKGNMNKIMQNATKRGN